MPKDDFESHAFVAGLLILVLAAVVLTFFQWAWRSRHVRGRDAERALESARSAKRAPITWRALLALDFALVCIAVGVGLLLFRNLGSTGPLGVVIVVLGGSVFMAAVLLIPVASVVAFVRNRRHFRVERLLADGKLLEAELELRDQIQRNENWIDAWVSLGAVLAQQERWHEALGAAETALRLAEGDPMQEELRATARANRALVLRRLQRTAEALELMETVRRDAPAHVANLCNLSRLLLEQGRADDARNALEQAEAVLETNDVERLRWAELVDGCRAVLENSLPGGVE